MPWLEMRLDGNCHMQVSKASYVRTLLFWSLATPRLCSCVCVTANSFIGYIDIQILLPQQCMLKTGDRTPERWALSSPAGKTRPRPRQAPNPPRLPLQVEGTPSQRGHTVLTPNQLSNAAWAAKGQNDALAHCYNKQPSRANRHAVLL